MTRPLTLRQRDRLSAGGTIHKPEKRWSMQATVLFVVVFNALAWTAIVIGIARSLG